MARIFICLIGLLVAIPSLAKPEEPVQRFHMSLGASQSMGLYNNSAGEHEQSTGLNLSMRYTVTDYWVASLNSSAVHVPHYDRRSGMTSTAVRFTRNFMPLKNSDDNVVETPNGAGGIKPILEASAPVSKDQKDMSYLGGVALRLMFVLGQQVLPSKDWMVSLTIGIARSFYTYSQALDGSPNARVGLGERLAISYRFSEDWTLSLSAAHANSWDFDNGHGEYYSHGQALIWDATPNWSVEVGHQFGNPLVNVYKADQYTLNYRFVDEEASSIYTSLTYSF